MKRDLRILFMGTPEFAVSSLDAIIRENYNVVGVVTAPDKPAGRGRKISISAVKEYCILKGLNVLQPEKLKHPDFIEDLKALNANLFVVVAFRMLPEIVWSLPEFGAFNLHASLLPQYRGAAPINHAIINGEQLTGVTTFFINNKIDTGSIIFQEKTPILVSDTAGELHDRLMILGSQLVIRTIEAIEGNSYSLTKQAQVIPKGILNEAPKIFKSDCRIDWHQDVKIIHNFIRGLSPYPAAYGDLVIDLNENVQVKFYKVHPVEMLHNNVIGSIETNNRNKLAIWAANGQIVVEELQSPGKRHLKISEFLNGFKLNRDSYFT